MKLQIVTEHVLEESLDEGRTWREIARSRSLGSLTQVKDGIERSEEASFDCDEPTLIERTYIGPAPVLGPKGDAA